MTIAGVGAKCKALVGRIPRDALVLAVLILASLASFGLGYLAGQDQAAGEGSDISIEITAPAAVATAPETAATTKQGVYVASKNGTKYYLPTCSGAKRISDAN